MAKFKNLPLATKTGTLTQHFIPQFSFRKKITYFLFAFVVCRIFVTTTLNFWWFCAVVVNSLYSRPTFLLVVYFPKGRFPGAHGPIKGAVLLPG